MTVTFVQSGTPITFSASDVPGNPPSAMPTVDGSNTDVSVTNNGPGFAAIQFGTAAAGLVGSNGTISVPPLTTLLLTSNAATLAAAAANPLVISGVQATLAATATFVHASSSARGTTLTIQRGTATPRQTF